MTQSMCCRHEGATPTRRWMRLQYLQSWMTLLYTASQEGEMRALFSTKCAHLCLLHYSDPGIGESPLSSTASIRILSLSYILLPASASPPINHCRSLLC